MSKRMLANGSNQRKKWESLAQEVHSYRHSDKISGFVGKWECMYPLALRLPPRGPLVHLVQHCAAKQATFNHAAARGLRDLPVIPKVPGFRVAGTSPLIHKGLGQSPHRPGQ